MCIKFCNRLDMSIDWWKHYTTEADQFATCFKKLADKKPGARFAVVVSGTRAVVPVPAPGIQNFFAPAPEQFGPIKLKTIVLFVQLACSTNCRLNGDSNFRLWLHHSKFFGSGSTALLETNCFWK